ncbi:hypothetical protein [Streptomyces sp. NPDC046860]|uniref:hypothetical protein n=1 Tax=Streptomyces sp. NPDC046860 TaxID=3154495 RepID=UPI0033FB3E62
MQPLPDLPDLPDPLISAFPARFAEDVEAVLAVMPAAQLEPVGFFPVGVEGREVSIPGRLYHDEPSAELVAALSPRQQRILHCLYSRHCDGRVRQRHLAEIVGHVDPWVVPYVLQLTGEYVVEILVAVLDGLRDLAAPGNPGHIAYGRFIVENPLHFARTQRRVVSYWNCYYRSVWSSFRGYPGCVLLDLFRSAASDSAGRPWPSLAPEARARVDGYC